MGTRRDPMPSRIGKAAKRAGAAGASGTPLNLRTAGVPVTERLEQYVRERSGRKLGKFARHVERGTVRFEDVNGPRGGEDTVCRIKLVVAGSPAVVVAETRDTARKAFDAAIAVAERALRRGIDRRGHRTGRPLPRTADRPSLVGPSTTARDGGGIGRRVGRSAADLARLREEKAKPRVDTAKPGKSATDRRAGGSSTAARNVKGRAPKASVALEDSARDRPSRKSTRRGAGRVKGDTPLRIRATNKAARRKR